MALPQRHLLPVLPFLFASTVACSDGGSGGTATGGAFGTGGASGGTNAVGGAATGGGPSSGGAASGGAPASGGSGAVGATGSTGTGASLSTGGTGGDTLATGGGTGETGGNGGATGGTAGSGGESASGGAATGGTGGGTGGTTAQAFALMSPSWEALDNEDCTDAMAAACPLYPQDNTSFGDNVSPEMSWPMGPEGTQSYAVVLSDLSNGLTHWALWDIPSTVTLLPASLPMGSPLSDPAGASQTTDFGQKKYFGSGACGHVYEHHLYALSVAKLEGTFANATAVRDAITASGAILAESFVRLQSRDYCQ